MLSANTHKSATIHAEALSSEDTSNLVLLAS